MSQIINATYADGMLKRDVEPDLPPGARVRLIVQALEHPSDSRRVIDEFDQLCADWPVDSGGERLTRDQSHERRLHKCPTECITLPT
jgi:predicted DNA-binding antitoxin AbrB/MazE fold protein